MTRLRDAWAVLRGRKVAVSTLRINGKPMHISGLTGDLVTSGGMTIGGYVTLDGDLTV